MKKNVLIVNNNANYAKELEKMVCEVNPYLEVAIINKVEEAYEYIMNVTVDMFILDPVMHPEKAGDISGIQLAEQIREIKKYTLTPIIFITTEEDPTLYAYEELNCLGYFVKPFLKEDFQMKVKRGLYYKTSRNANKALFFRKGGIIYPIKIKEIAYIESIPNGMRVHLGDGSTTEVLYKTCRSILWEADSEFLFQCSRGIIVNRNYILGVDFSKRYIVLKQNLGILDIGVTYKKRVKEEFEGVIF